MASVLRNLRGAAQGMALRARWDGRRVGAAVRRRGGCAAFWGIVCAAQRRRMKERKRLWNDGFLAALRCWRCVVWSAVRCWSMLRAVRRRRSWPEWRSSSGRWSVRKESKEIGFTAIGSLPYRDIPCAPRRCTPIYPAGRSLYMCCGGWKTAFGTWCGRLAADCRPYISQIGEFCRKIRITSRAKVPRLFSRDSFRRTCMAELAARSGAVK